MELMVTFPTPLALMSNDNSASGSSQRVPSQVGVGWERKDWSLHAMPGPMNTLPPHTPGPGCLFGTIFFSVPRSYSIHLFSCIQYPESRPFSVLGNLRVMELYGDIASSFLFARGIAKCSGILISTSDHPALEKSKVSCPRIEWLSTPLQSWKGQGRIIGRKKNGQAGKITVDKIFCLLIYVLDIALST